MSSLAVVRTGSQTPRLEHFPAFFTTAADDAVDLASVAGLVMDPWQEHVLRHSLGERRDGRWTTFRTCLVVPRQNGKNAVLEARELAGLFLFGEKLIVHTAHEYKTARESMMSMMARVRQAPELLELVAGFDEADFDEDEGRRISGMKTGNAPGITLKNGNRLSYAARSKGSGRGFTGDLVILDEAYALSLDEMAALLPTMAARSIAGNPQVWFTSSAGMPESSLLASLRKQGREKKVDRLAYFEWSADPSVASDDVNAWYEANPGLGVRISEEFVQDEFDTLARETGSDEQFRRERLGIWEDDLDGTGVIDATAWSSRSGKLVAPVGAVVLAVETTLDRKMSVLVAVGSGADGVPQVRVVDSQARTGWVPSRVVEVCRDHPEVVAVVMDERDSADPVADAIAEALEAAKLNVDIVRMNYPDTAEACADTFDLIHEGQLRHRGDDGLLNTAVRGAVKQENEGGFVWSRRKGGAAVAPLVAMTRGLWEWRRRVAASYDVMDSVL